MRNTIITIVAVIVVLSTTVSSSSFAVLKESEVLLLWNSENAESSSIARYYFARHPQVIRFDLAPFLDTYTYPGHTPGQYSVNEFYITPDAFTDKVRAPLIQFLTTSDLGVKAIATTRGLPAAISVDFEPAIDHSYTTIRGSFEAQLARLNVTFNYPAFCPNPYYGRDGLTFSDFLAQPSPGGACFVSKMYVVSRLDSGIPFGLLPYPHDYDGDNDVDHVDGVKALIDRSLNLVVDQAQVIIVLDDLVPSGFPSGLARDRRALDFMFDQGWCTFFDETCNFLDGEGAPGWDPGVEGQYANRPELVRVGWGYNHGALGCDPVSSNGYILQYDPHPAGLFVSIESFNGVSLHIPINFGPHGQVLHWIGRGGSFTCGNVNGPNLNETAHADFVMTNLYVHGLSWGEAIWASLQDLGRFQTPIGDPLATVTVTPGNDTCPFGPPNASSESWPPADPPANCFP